jgi:hypothetical protein
MSIVRTGRVDAYRMIQHRAAELGMKIKIGCHVETGKNLGDRKGISSAI